jgi:hypothetical protein
MTKDTRQSRDAASLVGHRVTARLATGEPHGMGKVISYTDRPSFEIERPDGSRFSWLAELTDDNGEG